MQSPQRMPALSNLLKRWGFVKLSRYGLVLTPEGRIMSVRPDVLDDGGGGRIVGWEDADLAPAELTRWAPARPAPATAVAARVASAPPPLPPVRVAAVTATALPIPALTPAARVVPPAPPVVVEPPSVPAAPAAPASVEVAPAEEPEDDWEWTIAIARARAAADDAEAAAPAMQPRTTRAHTVPPPPPASEGPNRSMLIDPPKPAVREPARTAQMPAVSAALGNIDYNDYSSPTRELARMNAVPKATPHQQAAVVPVNRATPATVIPVPKLPSIARAAAAPQKLEPVVAARRLAAVKAVKSALPPSPTPSMPPSMPASMPDDERTKTTVTAAPAPAQDDLTKPGITLAAVAAMSAANDDRTKPGILLPSVKRLASR
ncbi:MAG: hypothetical protein KF773_03135 [Deltaproteobacteria bacterium]|nr:hypothetical protein [Deltaproteobacteria bacterium]